MNVLSLFDGMSCGRIALERVGIEVDNYFASEIDKYAIQVSKKNYPSIKHIGSVLNVKASDLPKIDLLIGGSPCQGFSFAGKQLNFEDERSKLFFEFVRLLAECKPKYFLLENVKMKKEYQDIISEYLGVEPTLINSALVSAQNRNRLYWTNIPDVMQLEDRGILLKDILEVETDIKFDLSEKATRYITDAIRLKKRQTVINGSKSICLLSQYSQSLNGTFLCVDSNGRMDSNKTGTISSRYYKGTENYGSNPFIYSNNKYRKLTPIECERLQTVPDNYTEGVSNSQRYKMLGNGWTVDVIAHIFKGLNSAR